MHRTLIASLVLVIIHAFWHSCAKILYFIYSKAVLKSCGSFTWIMDSRLFSILRSVKIDNRDVRTETSELCRQTQYLYKFSSSSMEVVEIE